MQKKWNPALKLSKANHYLVRILTEGKNRNLHMRTQLCKSLSPALWVNNDKLSIGGMGGALTFNISVLHLERAECSQLGSKVP